MVVSLSTVPSACHTYTLTIYNNYSSVVVCHFVTICSLQLMLGSKGLYMNHLSYSRCNMVTEMTMPLHHLFASFRDMW